MKKNFKSFLNSRKFKYGSVSTALTVVFIAVVVIINVIFSLLSDTYSWKMDLTANELYSISMESEQIVRSQTKDNKITFTVMCEEGSFPDPYGEIIKRYANLSSNIELKYVDPVKNPMILDSFGEEFDVQAYSVVVQCNGRTRVIDPSEMDEYDEEYYQQYGQYVVTSYTLEERLSSAILYVTKEDIPLTYFVTGHGESGYEELMALMANGGTDVKEITLDEFKKNTDFDGKARTIVVCGPTKDFSRQDIKMLDAFLQNDYNYERNLFYFAAPEAGALPNLHAYLQENWEIKVDQNLILEGDAYCAPGYTQNPSEIPLYLKTSYNDSAAIGVEEMTVAVNKECVVPYAGSLQIVDDPKNIVEADELLVTSEDSWAKSTKNLNEGYGKTKNDKTGPFCVAAIATKSTVTNNVNVESHVFVSGSTMMLGESYMKEKGNSEYLHKIYQIMVDETELEIGGAIKYAADESMDIDQEKAQLLYILIIAVIPCICLLIGAIVFIRRRFL